MTQHNPEVILTRHITSHTGIPVADVNVPAETYEFGAFVQLGTGQRVYLLRSYEYMRPCFYRHINQYLNPPQFTLYDDNGLTGLLCDPKQFATVETIARTMRAHKYGCTFDEPWPTVPLIDILLGDPSEAPFRPKMTLKPRGTVDAFVKIAPPILPQSLIDNLYSALERRSHD